ncbi:MULTISPECIES: hypothetical protein [Pseudomonas]|uniref:hypothetical protein n=1 Tax=Pseudomonas TaxID=286 RepID=UPI0018E7D34F|nr:MULTISPECIES: hypothetical protein [Pseudomonas]MBJ2347759.1 hypothetical protein [Pseudomonas canavaninivorans]MBL3543980.1 hypothetical protein [Pseudomonas sp. HB05]
MHLIDSYLPAYQFRELHALDVPTDPPSAMAAILAHRPEDVRLFRYAIKLRELPMRLLGHSQSHRAGQSASFGLDNFTLLQRNGDAEIAYGLAGKLWKADYGQVFIADAEAFEAFNEPGNVKLAINFTCQSLQPGLTRVTTQTRVQCIDADALRSFTAYWYLIRPVSGLIRRRMLKAIARRCAAGALKSTSGDHTDDLI